jgi:uncharacterized repeat protein (TIGR01451 family)
VCIGDGKGLRGWLPWIGLLLLGLVLAGAMAGGGEPSQALSPAEVGAVGQVADRLPLNGLYTVTLPFISRNHEVARFTIAKDVTPKGLIASPTAMVTYTVTIVNAGKEPGALSAVVDTLPAGFTFDDMVVTQSDVDVPPTAETGLIRWNGSPSWPMAGGQQLRLVYRVKASETLGTHINQANVEALVGTPPRGPASAAVIVLPKVLMQDNFNGGISLWTEFLNYKYRLAPGQWYWGPTDGFGGSGALSHDALKVPGKVAADALMMYLQPGAQDWTDYRVETSLYLTGGVTEDGDPLPNAGDPIGLWVRGHWQPSGTNAQWISGYYVVVVGGNNSDRHWVRLAQPQIPGDCDGACDNPDTQYAFNNVMVLCDYRKNGCGTAFPGGFKHYQWYGLAVEVRGNNIKAWLNGALAFDYTDTNQPFLTGTVGYKVHETKTASFDDIVVSPLP